MSRHEGHAAGEPTELGVELRKEAWVMALYVAVCLLAALTALAEHSSDGHVRALGVIWGTTIGLTPAHVFGFRVSARLVAEGQIPRGDAATVGAQLVGSAAVAVLATIPVLMWPASAELDAVRWSLALFVAVVGFVVARGAGAGTMRSGIYGAVLFVAAVTIAITKNILSGH